MYALSGLCIIIGSVCLLFLASTTRADGVTGAGNAVPVLQMGTSDGPPYMIRESDSGLDIDIPRAVLRRLGYDLNIRYMPLARASREVLNKRLDLMAPMFVSSSGEGFRSHPHIFYRPTAFSMQEKDLQIRNLKDLGRYRMMTFQGATGYFGPGFVDASRQSPVYREVSDMRILPSMLMAGRTDIVVLDYYIFLHFSRLSKVEGWYGALAIHEIFPRVPATVMFHDAGLRDQFNIGLSAIKADGRYQEILDQYE